MQTFRYLQFRDKLNWSINTLIVYPFKNRACDINNKFRVSPLLFVKIHSFVCDASASAFLKYTKQHTGYLSCDKYIKPGDIKNKIFFICQHIIDVRDVIKTLLVYHLTSSC